MDRRSDEAAEAVLAALTPAQRERLVRAMAEAHALLRAAGERIERVDPADRDARWCVAQYDAELARRFATGFDARRSIPADDAELRPPHGVMLISTVDGAPVACGAVKRVAPTVGTVKRMWVADDLRGLGFRRRVLAALEPEARMLGVRTLRLETNGALVEAIRL